MPLRQFPRLAEHHAVVGVEQFVEHLHVAEAVHEHVVDVHGEHIAIIGEFRDLAEEQGPFAQIETVVVEFEAALQDVGPFLRRRQMRHVDMSGVHFGHRFEDLETGLLAFLVDDRAHDGMAADHIVQRLVKHVGPEVAVHAGVEVDIATQAARLVLHEAFAVEIQRFLKMHQRKVGHVAVRVRFAKDAGPQVVRHLPDGGQTQEVLADLRFRKHLADSVEQGERLGDVPR